MCCRSHDNGFGQSHRHVTNLIEPVQCGMSPVVVAKIKQTQCCSRHALDVKATACCLTTANRVVQGHYFSGWETVWEMGREMGFPQSCELYERVCPLKTCQCNTHCSFWRPLATSGHSLVGANAICVSLYIEPPGLRNCGERVPPGFSFMAYNPCMCVEVQGTQPCPAPRQTVQTQA